MKKIIIGIIAFILSILLVLFRCWILMMTYEWHLMEPLGLYVLPFGFFIGCVIIMAGVKKYKKEATESAYEHISDSFAVSFVLLSFSWVVRFI